MAIPEVTENVKAQALSSSLRGKFRWSVTHKFDVGIWIPNVFTF